MKQACLLGKSSSYFYINGKNKLINTSGNEINNRDQRHAHINTVCILDEVREDVNKENKDSTIQLTKKCEERV
ncbi:hypothetical protein M3603_09550 [Rummeliibacillus stabekisii]|uniref:hypothetical protein n=1 Tax=Rummeliibacillus stabekisii TaxID=241244 RepID=UPI002041FD6C|nr:hypothetical protein [Rummeliibacillus stabekisii]MCM3316910.1 hypothetical protein [Rummeliibacillus stabekisii]